MTNTSATSQIDQLTAGASLERAVLHLQSRQHADGWWKGALDTNVTMDAEDLLLREFLGIRRDRETQMAANWIRSELLRELEASGRTAADSPVPPAGPAAPGSARRSPDR